MVEDAAKKRLTGRPEEREKDRVVGGGPQPNRLFLSRAAKQTKRSGSHRNFKYKQSAMSIATVCRV